jgi:hypothetical protein
MIFYLSATLVALSGALLEGGGWAMSGLGSRGMWVSEVTLSARKKPSWELGIALKYSNWKKKQQQNNNNNKITTPPTPPPPPHPQTKN